MQTSVERLEGDTIKLNITVPAAEVDREIEAAYGRLGAKLRIPGFRPGKAPRPVIDTHVGRDAVLAEAQENIVSDAYGRAVSAEGLRTLGQPDVGELDAIVPGSDFTFSAEVQLRPELKLTGLKDLTVTVPTKVATDREIDAQIEYTRERFATLETVDAPVGENDFALISFVGMVDGEAYEGNSVDRYMYEVGRGMMPKEFDQALIGVKPGGKATAEFVIPDTSSVEDFVGKTAHFDIDVHEVKTKVLPALDKEFAFVAGGFDSYDEYRDNVRERLDTAKQSGHAARVEAAVLDVLVGRLVGEVPEEMIQARTATMTREFFGGLEERGISLEEYVEMAGVPVQQIQTDIRAQAEVRLREELALEALFRDQGMEISDADVDEAIREMVKEDAAEAEKMKEQLTVNGALPIVREQLMHRKAMKWLMDAVTVIEEEPS